MKNPQALRPGTAEPNRAMSDEDARALTAFLISQKGGGKSEVGKEMIRHSLTIVTLFARARNVAGHILFAQDRVRAAAQADRIRCGHRRIQRGKADRADR